MIKKQITFFLIFLFIGINLTAENSPIELDGTFKFSVNDENLLRNEFEEAETGPSFDSEIELNAIFSELFKNETLEVGMTFNIDDAFTFIAETSEDNENPDTNESYYNNIQKMIDWYVNNRDRYEMDQYPNGLTEWPTSFYGAAPRYQFIIGNTVENTKSVAWTDDKHDDARALFTDIKDAILAEIQDISTIVDVTNTSTFSQEIVSGLIPAEKTAFLLEKEAYDSFMEAYRGSSSDATLGDLISDGYITIKDIGGVLDVTMEYNGREVSIGHAIESVRAKQENPLLGVEAALALGEDVLPDFSASLLVVLTEGEESSPEDWETKEYDYDEGEVGNVGILLNAKYNIKSIGSLEIEGGLLDVVNPGNFVVGIYPTLDIWHMSKLKIAGEFNLLGYEDEKNPNDSVKIGMAAALDAQATFVGITPRAQMFWKNDQFFGDGSANLEEDRLAGTSMMDDFNSTNAKSAAALDASLYFDTSKLIGREIISIGGGYNMFVYDPFNDTRFFRHGWYAGLDFTLKDLAEIPLSVTFLMTKYNPSEQVVFADYAGTGTASSFIDGLYWDLDVEFEFSDNLTFMASCNGSDSGNRLDTSMIVGWDFSVVATF
ncbi:MAG: hypothetical protein GY754_10285 [bacterium]|nr:hypothetical protein [bacterium]